MWEYPREGDEYRTLATLGTTAVAYVRVPVAAIRSIEFKDTIDADAALFSD